MRRRIKVVRIIDRLNVGGPAIHAVLTTQGLDPARFETLLVTGDIEPGEADMSYLLDQYGVRRVLMPSLGRELRPTRDVTTARAVFDLIRRERPDVVHTHKAKAGALGRVVALAARVPVRVHTFHGHVFDGYFGPRKTKAFIAIERALARTTTRLVALSDRLVEELAHRYRIAPANRFTVVPLGFDLTPFADCERYRGELRRRLNAAPRTRLVGIVGRMVPVKDHATFIAAAAQLTLRRDDVAFVMIGGGELERELRADVARRGLSERTHFLGWSRDLERLYADLDVVALSSQNEGTPVALIEAMACGVPVAATAVGGVPDVLRDGALGELASARDPVALADAIDRALSPTARARAATQRAAIISDYGSVRLCRDLEGLYEELLAERGVL